MKRTGNILKWAMVLLCSIALAVSIVLFIHSLGGRALIGCGEGSSCNSVLGSRWSLLLGVIPVSALSACIYSFILVCILGVGSIDDSKFESQVRCLMLVVSGALLGAAAWFIFVQKHFIGAFCPYCMSAHCCGLVLAALLIWDAHHHGVAEKPARRILLVLAGIASAAVLALIQLGTTPRSAYDSGSANKYLPEMHEFGLPVIGDREAENKILLLYDYRCSHCRKIHQMLPEVVELLEGKVSFTLCPTPLGKECNPYISSEVDLFKGSCTLDKCALAVWKADSAKFSQMDEFLFEAGRGGWYPREEQEAMDMAATLIGEEALKRELHSEWMTDYLTSVLELFARTSAPQRAAIPRFICNSHYMVPEADSAEALAQLIRQLINDSI